MTQHAFRRLYIITWYMRLFITFFEVVLGVSSALLRPGSSFIFRVPPWTFTVDDDRLPLVAATSTFMYPCRHTAYPLRSLTRRKYPNLFFSSQSSMKK